MFVITFPMTYVLQSFSCIIVKFSLFFFFSHRPPGASCNIFSLAEVSLGEMDRNFGLFIETRSPSTFNWLFSNIMRTNYRKGDIMKTQVVRSCGMKTKAHKGSRPWTAGSRINTLRWQTWKLICVMFLIPPSNLMCTLLLIWLYCFFLCFISHIS